MGTGNTSHRGTKMARGLEPQEGALILIIMAVLQEEMEAPATREPNDASAVER
jgi:hypothetical protein